MEAHHIEHRDVTGGGPRAAVFGASDGLLTNVALILGVLGAPHSARTVVIAGVAGLVAGAFSMGIGEYISMTAQRELLERELDVERSEIASRPEAETLELARLYEARGVPKDLAAEVAKYLMDDPEVALRVHAQEELGVAPEATGSPLQAALASFGLFSVGAAIPLLPWFFLTGSAAALTSLALSALAAGGLGATLAALSGRSVALGAARQLLLAALAAAVTFGIGHLVGVAVG
jgi:VIT1/CCC1 family predicted Fe2+/Mn2+ transporter